VYPLIKMELKRFFIIDMLATFNHLPSNYNVEFGACEIENQFNRTVCKKIFLGPSFQLPFLSFILCPFKFYFFTANMRSGIRLRKSIF
jgi:hypothetical protein